jgi:hypothetical protein
MTPAPRGADRAGGDAGTGLIGATTSVLVFFILLLFAMQLMLGLYGTSTLTAVAHDAARRAAGRDGPRTPAALATYESVARSQLGALGRSAATRFDWRLEDDDGDGVTDVVRLTITVGDPPRVLPARFGGLLGFDPLRETVRVRVERFVPQRGTQP